MLVETPVSITSFFRPWKKSSDFAQPEIFFWPERGATFNVNFKGLKNVHEKKGDPSMSDQRIQDHLRNYLIFQINREKIFHEDEKKTRTPGKRINTIFVPFFSGILVLFSLKNSRSWTS